jgi:transposase
MMFSYLSPESRVPVTRCGRSRRADKVLRSMSRDFDELYALDGRPSIAPERLLKGSILIALYSLRSERMLCEMLDYNTLFRWFLDMSMDEPTLDQSRLRRFRQRLVASDCAQRFFNAVPPERSV